MDGAQEVRAHPPPPLFISRKKMRTSKKWKNTT